MSKASRTRGANIQIADAWNAQRKHFPATAIDDAHVLAGELRGKELMDRWRRPVEPVARSANVSPHFRLLRTFSDGISLDRRESNPQHNDCIDFLIAKLSAAQRVSVLTDKWIKTGKGGGFQRVPIWSSSPIKPPSWRKDPSTRIWVDAKHYFQPDIVGYDSEEPAASPFNRRLIVEVVRSHWPDRAAWDALVDLSAKNHTVVFYFVDRKGFGNWINKVSRTTHLELDCTYYLQHAQLFEKSKLLSAPQGNTDPYTHLKTLVWQLKNQTFAKQRKAQG